jgi:epsin
MDKWLDMNKLQSTFNKIKYAINNTPEYAAKVLEATNNEPWGASSTLMLDIANATSQYQQ